MRTGNDGWRGERRWRAWAGVIAMATSVTVAAPAQAAGRGAAPSNGVAYNLGRALGTFGLIAWFLRSRVGRRNEGERCATTIQPANPPSTGPGLVGSACVHCRQKIFVQHAAALCQTCAQPVHHLDCRKSHQAAAHEHA